MKRVVPSTSQTCLATNQVVADCETLLQTVESSSTFCNKIRACCGFNRPQAPDKLVLCMAWLPRNFIQSEDTIHGTCINLICCTTGLNLVGETRTSQTFFWVNLKLLKLQLRQRSYLHLKICISAVHITFILAKTSLLYRGPVGKCLITCCKRRLRISPLASSLCIRLTLLSFQFLNSAKQKIIIFY